MRKKALQPRSGGRAKAAGSGRRIVAESVETREVLERLRKFGCDFVQGYFISPPLEKSVLRRWLLDPPVFSPPQ
jgi:EAL domain-containing protein (putative c-di-GMP-specific phosphodiesterase class I)